MTEVHGEAKKPLVLPVAMALWILAVGFGFARLLGYAATPGSAAPAPVRWPVGIPLTPDPERANLVLLAHPHCPCTRSSLDELELLLTRCQGRVTAHVLFYRPAAFPPDWEKTELWDRAGAFPGIQVRADEGGVLARRFGAVTSGQVLLYHRGGHLLFRGGLTNARGHAGASAGAAAVVSLLTRGTAERTETPVFGCPLTDPGPPAHPGD